MSTHLLFLHKDPPPYETSKVCNLFYIGPYLPEYEESTMESDAPTQWHLSVVVMLSLCQPYSPSITCLCDETASVFICFITREEGDRDNNIQEDMVTNKAKSAGYQQWP